MRAMAQWWAAPTRRTMFARVMHARVRRQARPCQRLPWESRARVSSRPVRRQELDGCRARSTTAVKPRSRVDASRRTFCHHLHESVQCTHWPDAGPRRLNRAPSQADLALLRQVTPAGASLGETASAVPTAGWKYLARSVPLCTVVWAPRSNTRSNSFPRTPCWCFTATMVAGANKLRSISLRKASARPTISKVASMPGRCLWTHLYPGTERGLDRRSRADSTAGPLTGYNGCPCPLLAVFGRSLRPSLREHR